VRTAPLLFFVLEQSTDVRKAGLQGVDVIEPEVMQAIELQYRCA